MKNTVSNISEPRKVLFIGPLPPPHGGVAAINQSIQGIKFDHYLPLTFDTSGKAERENLKTKISISKLYRNFRIIRNLKSLIKAEQPVIANIFITSGWSIIRDLIFLRIVSSAQIPVIIHFHSKLEGEFALKLRRLKIVGYYFNKYASKILLLSNWHYRHFTQYFDVQKCDILENFVDYKSFDNEINRKKNTFLYVGRLSKEKGFFDLLEAVRKLKNKGINFNVQVIGLAPSELIEEEINDFVYKNEIQDYFVFNGAKFGDSKCDLFKDSKCLIFPSHFENSPVVLKEAIASKMAILASDIKANLNVLGEHQNFISFKNGNPQDLAAKLFVMLSESEKLYEMCNFSAQIKDFDKAVAKTKLESIFNDLIRG